MPVIAELRGIDGAIWARVPVTGDEGQIQIMSEAEIQAQQKREQGQLAEIERLRKLVADFADAVEKQAFDIPPPCPQVPVLVSLAVQTRFCLDAIEQTGSDPKEGT